MTTSELYSRSSELSSIQASLEEEQTSSQSPAKQKSISKRLAEVTAELSAVQKALAVVVGGFAISALNDDGFDDNDPPVITITGSNPLTVELGSTYTDAGATANDAYRGSTSVSSSGSVNTDVLGSYTITYTATDLDGNSASATRTVNVVDTTDPVLTVTGGSPTSTELGGTYNDAGATASDASGSVDVTSSGTVDTSTLGSYTISYSSTDASGNT